MPSLLHHAVILKKKLTTLNEEIESIKTQLLTMSAKLKRSNETNSEDESDWSLVRGKKTKPSVLLVGTSNIKGIEPSQLSTKYHTSKETAYTIEQATNIIQDYPPQPDVIAYHILSNQIKSSSSGECVDKLLNLVKKTKELKPDSKIIVSLATNRCDDRKLNRKVNTVNSLLHEFSEDTSVDTQFVLCENNNLSTANSEIRNKFITTDGYHLSNEGVKMLASNLRRSIDKVLDIPQNSMRKDPRPRRPWRRPNEQRQRRDSVSQ